MHTYSQINIDLILKQELLQIKKKKKFNRNNFQQKTFKSTYRHEVTHNK